MRLPSPLAYSRTASLCASLALLFAACDLTGTGSSPSLLVPGNTLEEANPPPAAAGGTCAGSRDCALGQVCVDSVCASANASVQGEILAAAAAAQLEAGDIAGASSTFQQTLEVYQARELEPPASVLCGAAHVMLQGPLEGDGRERAARFAYRCIRASLPGSAARQRVVRSLSRMRYDGLNLAAFDLPDEPEAFFTARPTRPDPNTVEVEFSMEPVSSRTFEPIQAALTGETARAAAQDCFLQDWEMRHEPDAEAALRVRLTARMRDMGDYDAFPPNLELEPSSLAQEGFEPCLVRALPSLVELPRDLYRPASYETTMTVHATLSRTP